MWICKKKKKADKKKTRELHFNVDCIQIKYLNQKNHSDH